MNTKNLEQRDADESPLEFEGGDKEKAEEKPAAQRRQRPGGIGIQKVKADEKAGQPEYPDSPFRKKKKTLDKLVLQDISKAPPTADTNSTHVAEFAKYELIGRLQVVMHQLELRRKQYEQLKLMSVDQIVEMYSYSEYKDLQIKWRKSLELNLPKGFQIDDKLLVEFHQWKKADFDQIDVFMNEFNDWHQDKLHDSEDKFKKVQKDAERPLMKPITIEMKISQKLFKSCPTTGKLLPNFDDQGSKKELTGEDLLKAMVQQSVQSSNIHPAILQHYQTLPNQKSILNEELVELTKSKADAPTSEMQEAWHNLEMELSRKHSENTGVPLDMGNPTLSRTTSKRQRRANNAAAAAAAAATSTTDLTPIKEVTNEDNTSKTIGWVLAGVAAIAVGAAIAIKMKQQKS